MKCNIVKNPNWQEAEQLATLYLQSVSEDLNLGIPKRKSR